MTSAELQAIEQAIRDEALAIFTGYGNMGSSAAMVAECHADRYMRAIRESLKQRNKPRQLELV